MKTNEMYYGKLIKKHMDRISKTIKDTHEKTDETERSMHMLRSQIGYLRSMLGPIINEEKETKKTKQKKKKAKK